MFLARCPFCTNTNPVGSRFCNACGSPLHLRPCPRCEGVNDVAARACHRCGATLDFDYARDVRPAQSATHTAHGVEIAEMEVALARAAADADDPIVLRAPREALARGDDRGTHADRDALAPSTGVETFATIPRVFDAAEELRPQPAARRSRAPAIAGITMLIVIAMTAYTWWPGARLLETSLPAATPAPDSVTPASEPSQATTPATSDASSSSQAPPAQTGAAAAVDAAVPTQSVDAGAQNPPVAESPKRENPATTTPAEDNASAVVAEEPSSPQTRRASPATIAKPKASQDALATDRVIRRSLGGFAPTPPTTGRAAR